MSECDDRPSLSELQDYDPNDASQRRALGYAAPVLVEIVATALALREQEVIAAKTRNAYSRSVGLGDATQRLYNASDRADRKLKSCRDAYDAALAKVRK